MNKNTEKQETLDTAKQFTLLHELLSHQENGLIEKLEINFNGSYDRYQGHGFDAIKGNTSISFSLTNKKI